MMVFLILYAIAAALYSNGYHDAGFYTLLAVTMFDGMQDQSSINALNKRIDRIGV